MLPNASADKYTDITTVYYIFAFLLIGVPIWWKSTAIHRAYIPFDEIVQLHNSNVSLTDYRFSARSHRFIFTQNVHSSQVSQLIHVRLIVDDASIDIDQLTASISDANAVRDSNVNSAHLQFSYAWNIRRASKSAEDVILNSKSLSTLDDNFKTVLEGVTADIIVVLSRSFSPHPRTIVGAYRTVFVASVEKDLKILARYLVKSVVYNVVREDVFRSISQPFSSEERKRVRTAYTNCSAPE